MKNTQTQTLTDIQKEIIKKAIRKSKKNGIQWLAENNNFEFMPKIDLFENGVKVYFWHSAAAVNYWIETYLYDKKIKTLGDRLLTTRFSDVYNISFLKKIDKEWMDGIVSDLEEELNFLKYMDDELKKDLQD